MVVYKSTRVPESFMNVVKGVRGECYDMSSERVLPEENQRRKDSGHEKHLDSIWIVRHR